MGTSIKAAFVKSKKFLRDNAPFIGLIKGILRRLNLLVVKKILKRQREIILCKDARTWVDKDISKRVKGIRVSPELFVL
jgi:hypothetical protein